MTSNYDEFSMHQSLHFSDNLKDLKDLRSQLYSAAEYFEISYANDDQKQAVVETLKDYVVKSVVTTLDHLGTFFYKMNDLLKEKAEEASGTELRISCLQQRLRTCQEYIDREGVSQQSLIINIPKYHKRYILPVGEKLHGKDGIMKHRGCSLEEEDEWEHLRNAVRATIGDEAAATAIRKGRSRPPSPGRPLPTSAFTISTRRGTAAGLTNETFYHFAIYYMLCLLSREKVGLPVPVPSATDGIDQHPKVCYAGFEQADHPDTFNFENPGRGDGEEVGIDKGRRRRGGGGGEEK